MCNYQIYFVEFLVTALICTIPQVFTTNINDVCDGYKCLKELETKDLNKLDEICRNNDIGLDRFCYCCGGVTEYHIYGNVCNRYCLKLFDIETVSFSKPCFLDKKKQEELRRTNANSDDEFLLGETAGFDFDAPFPNTPTKMPTEDITCRSDIGKAQSLPNFVQTSQHGQDIEKLIPTSRHAATQQNEFTKSMHDFTQAILNEIWSEDPSGKKNFVFSPFSLHITLAMLASGSTDNSTTQNELLGALGRSRNIERLESNYRSLLEEYDQIGTTLTYGNKVWTTRNLFFKLEDTFLESLDFNYFVEFDVLGRAPEDQINAWVREKTKEKITKLVDSIPANVQLLLTNAVYFKDAWTKAFDPVPAEKKFTLVDGTKVPVEMMIRDSTDFIVVPELSFDQLPPGLKYTVVSIPYQSMDQQFEMIIVMPENEHGLSIIGDSLRSGSKRGGSNNEYENILDKITNAVELGRRKEKELFTLMMPMFTVQSDLPIVDYMTKMGVNAAFETGEFDKISPEIKLKVSEIKHKAVVEVTKEGTTGVAATGIELGVLSGNVDNSKITVDKPFIFLIRDRRSENIIFIGNINNPTV